MQKDDFGDGLAELNPFIPLRYNWLRSLKKMHFCGVILVKLTIPVSEKREFDEKGDFLKGEKGRLG